MQTMPVAQVGYTALESELDAEGWDRMRKWERIRLLDDGVELSLEFQDERL